MNVNLSNISMNGRMAYTIMCVEAFLKATHPDRDWTLLSTKMWEATSSNWGDWPDMFCGYIPHVLFQYDTYDADDLESSMTEQEFYIMKNTYNGITIGDEDNPNDEVDFVIKKPFEISMVYEGTTIGDGYESLEIIAELENVLSSHGIPLPDYRKVEFSSIKELNGWGHDFDGRYLSVLLN